MDKLRYGDSRGKLHRVGHPDEVWPYDFLEERTLRGGKLRLQSILDEHTRECLTIHVASSISSRQMIAILDWLLLVQCASDHLRSNNSPEFITYAAQDSLPECHCQILYITHKSPWETPSLNVLKGSFGTTD